MSISTANAADNGLYATTNLSNPANFTKLIWAQATGTLTLSPFIGGTNSGFTDFMELASGANLNIRPGNDTFNHFASNPVFGDWTCYVLTSTTPGAGSVNGYFQDNAGGGWVNLSLTGVAITLAYDYISGGVTTVGMPSTFAYYMEWNTVLTQAQINQQFVSSVPVVALSNLRRYLPLANTTTAGNDSSGNGFNMTVAGTITNGASNPTFPRHSSYIIFEG